MTAPIKRLIVGMTGATGSIYGLRILDALRAAGGWETHLIVSEAGMLNAHQEYQLSRKDIQKRADVVHNVRDVGATLASGSFLTEGLVIATCSMKTLSGVAHAYSDNLITRAADVVLKERRRLVLVTREAPLNLAHLRNMVAVTEKIAGFRVCLLIGSDLATWQAGTVGKFAEGVSVYRMTSKDTIERVSAEVGQWVSGRKVLVALDLKVMYPGRDATLRHAT